MSDYFKDTVAESLCGELVTEGGEFVCIMKKPCPNHPEARPKLKIPSLVKQRRRTQAIQALAAEDACESTPPEAVGARETGRDIEKHMRRCTDCRAPENDLCPAHPECQIDRVKPPPSEGLEAADVMVAGGCCATNAP